MRSVPPGGLALGRLRHPRSVGEPVVRAARRHRRAGGDGDQHRDGEATSIATSTATVAPPAPAGNIVSAEGVAAFDGLGKDAIERLKKANVLFGHHTVGQNIIQGASAAGFTFHKVNFQADYAGGGFGSISLVDSDDSRRKVKTFGSIVLDQKMAATADVVALELGTSGFSESSKVTALKEAYSAHVDALRTTFPKVRLMHITPPLTTGISKENRARQEVSDWIKQTYGDRDVVFDLGGVESTRVDGRPCQGEKVRALCGEYGATDGRLGVEPAKRVAKAFLYALSRTLAR